MSNQVVFVHHRNVPENIYKKQAQKKRPRLLLPEALLHDKGVFIARMTSLNTASMAKMRQ
ncbi:hypothetical protein ECSTEC94C_1021 [Escherichia coli STEC_94C]|nr:hypothetical protein ECSTEC94C_1021 [Escherichia coli STEC_94C]